MKLGTILWRDFVIFSKNFRPGMILGNIFHESRSKSSHLGRREQPGLENLGEYPSKHHTADIHQHIRPYHVHMNNPPTLLPRAMKPSTRQGCAEILGDPYSKKSPLPSIGNFPCLADPPKLSSSYQVLGQSRIQQRYITRYDHPRIEAQ